MSLCTNNQIILQERDPQNLFITSDSKLTEPLIQLLKLDGLWEENDTLETIVKKTQAAWIATRQGVNNKERIDLTDSDIQQRQRQKVEEFANKLGLLKERKPALKHYKYAVVLGGFLDSMAHRLQNIVKQWQDGITFDYLVYATGERTLRKSPNEEDDIAKLGLTLKDKQYETEYDLAKILHSVTVLPTDMESALKGRVVFVNAPKGAAARPGTKDTITTWLKDYHPEPGLVLCASSPLVWTYQHIAVKNVLGSDYPVDTIAEPLQPEEYHKYEQRLVSVVHDTVAKCLYEISQSSKRL